MPNLQNPLHLIFIIYRNTTIMPTPPTNLFVLTIRMENCSGYTGMLLTVKRPSSFSSVSHSVELCPQAAKLTLLDCFKGFVDLGSVVYSVLSSAFFLNMFLVVVYHIVGRCGGSGVVARNKELRDEEVRVYLLWVFFFSPSFIFSFPFRAEIRSSGVKLEV